MVGRKVLFFVMCAGLLLVSCSKKNPTQAGTAPVITTQPASQTVTEGSSVSFTVAATGDPTPTYQWQKNGNDISGATSATYSIASTTQSNSGIYRVIVTNSAGSDTSNQATLVVNPSGLAAPVIATQPVSDTVDSGSSVSFTVVATGNPAPTYQWRKNGVNIPGATSATYTINSVTPADAGTYTVRVSNSQGSVTSNGAVLTVNRGPKTESWPYEISNDTIIIHHPADTSYYTYCDYMADTLVTNTNIDSASTERDKFLLSGNTFTIYGVGDSGTDSIIFTRVGTGSGIQGEWTGTLQGTQIDAVFTSTTLTVTETGNGNNNCPADDYVQYEWWFDTSSSLGNLDGTIAELSCTQVRITGNVTGEQVTIMWAGNGDMTYTSTVGAHTQYTYINNPTSCPDNYEPDWFWSANGFMTSNQKGIAKRAVGAVAPSAAVLLDMQKKMILLKHKHKHLL